MAEMKRIEAAWIDCDRRIQTAEQLDAFVRAAAMLRESLRPSAQKLRAALAVNRPRRPLKFAKNGALVGQPLVERAVVGELKRIELEEERGERIGRRGVPF